AVEVPGPNAPDPGASSNITLDLAAGNYAMLCFVDVPGGVPHAMKGMVKSLTVKPAAAGAVAVAAPTPDVTIELADFAFKPSAPLTAGKHVIKVTSAGPQVHEVEIVRFAPGKTLEDLGKWMKKPEGPPPANAIGGVSGMKPGMAPTFEVDLTA